MLRILVVLDWYLPGYKSGGPIRTLANLVERLGDRFEFFVLTTDRDWNDSHPYDGVALNCWTSAAKANVFYAPRLSGPVIRRSIQAVCPDLIYLNSFYSPSTIRTLLLRRMGLLPRVPVLLAVRGQFKSSALSLKAGKKQWFRNVAMRVGLYEGVLWQATSEDERKEIESLVAGQVPVFVAPNLPPATVPTWNELPAKVPGEARFAYVSRVSPVKNMRSLLEALSGVRGHCVLVDIYGPIDDVRYWEQQCLPLMPALPPEVKVAYRGTVANESVPKILADHHFFVLPTLGENFGHSILEALAAGCPAIISDRTPWRNLASYNVGWDLPLHSPGLWTESLQRCVDMHAGEHATMSHSAREFAVRWITSDDINLPTVTMLTQAAGVSVAPVSGALSDSCGTDF